MDIFILLVLFSALIGFWAKNWGRDGIIWFFVALFISPLITAIALMVVGKSIEKKAEELAEITRINNTNKGN